MPDRYACKLCLSSHISASSLVRHLYFEHEVLPQEATVQGSHLNRRATDYPFDDAIVLPACWPAAERRRRLAATLGPLALLS